MRRKRSKIDCPTFQKKQFLLRSITNTMNKAKKVREKAELAEDLGRESEVLLSCMDYDDGRFACGACHSVAHLQRETAELIMKAQKLA